MNRSVLFNIYYCNIMAEGFRFMPLGLVRLRTFRLCAWLLRCNINAGVQARGRSGRVTQGCHNSPEGKRGYRERVTSRTGSARRIWGILKKSVCRNEFCLGRRRLAFACSPKPGQWPCGGCHTCWWGVGDGKARIERMCTSLLMSKNL